MSRRVAVECMCGWRGRKVYRLDICECDVSCTHSPFGPCPKCGGRVTDSEFVRDMNKWAKRDLAPALEALKGR